MVFANDHDAGDPSNCGPGALYIRKFAPEFGDTQSAAEALEGLLLVQSGQFPSFEIECACHAPNTQRWFLMLVLPLRGSPGSVLVSRSDRTERNLMELVLGTAGERLSKTEHRYRSLFNEASDAVLVHQSATAALPPVSSMSTTTLAACSDTPGKRC